jgi:hypothetical protein
MKKLFELPLTVDELYWAGLLHADGSICRTTNRVVLVQKDRHVLEEFLKFLDQNSKITYRGGNTPFGWSEGYSATTGKCGQALRAIGVKGEPVSELYASRHFWRGMVDGDGSVKTEKDGSRPAIWLCSGKERDIRAFCEWIGSLFEYSGPKPYQAGLNKWYAYASHARGRILGLYLYRNSYSAVPSKRDTALAFETNTRRINKQLVFTGVEI